MNDRFSNGGSTGELGGEIAGLLCLAVDREDVCATSVCRPSVVEFSGSTETSPSDDAGDWMSRAVGGGERTS